MRPREKVQKAAVVGTTSWGTTLAIVLAHKGIPVSLWARTPKEARELVTARENRRLLPGFLFPDGLAVTPRPEEALEGAALVIFAVPSARMRENARLLSPYFRSPVSVLSATKGLEAGSALRMSQVLAEELPASVTRDISVLSGPNLSQEIVQRKPAATVIAAEDEKTAYRTSLFLNSSAFSTYLSTDVIGVELGGALKNVVAIAAGMADGLGLGNNAKATLITHGVEEISRLGAAAGADVQTFRGLACLGDLLATCFSPLSRNRTLGEGLAAGKGLEELREQMGHVAEGVDTTRAAMQLMERLHVDMPIARAVYSVLFQGASPRAALESVIRDKESSG